MLDLSNICTHHIEVSPCMNMLLRAGEKRKLSSKSLGSVNKSFLHFVLNMLIDRFCLFQRAHG